MPLDVVDLRSFYASPLGRLAHRTASDVVRTWWPNTVGLTILGCGFPLPYLDVFRDEAMRTMAFMPAEQGVVHWPPHGTAPTSATSLVESDLLPLPDGSVDRVLLVHLLEVTEHPRDVLDEVWRILNPGGRMIVIAPNRRGLWARVDSTPFGFGQPYSRGQISRLLRETLFSPERSEEILYVPPSTHRSMLRLARLFESVGGRLGLPGAGLHVVEASKQLYRPVLLRKTLRRSVPAFKPVLAPLGVQRRGD